MSGTEAEFILERKRFFFYRFVACAFPFFEVKSVLPIDRYQDATSKAISLHELSKVQLQERYTLVTQDSIGHLKTLCMSVLSLAVALESEWKGYSSSQSDKTNASVNSAWYNKEIIVFTNFICDHDCGNLFLLLVNCLIPHLKF